MVFLYPVFGASDIPPVSNRAPLENEIGYRPADGAEVRVSPPGFVWLPEAEVVSYTLQCSQSSDFSSIGYEKKGIQHNVHCPSIVFNPGLWYWRYAFQTQDGTQSEWSQIRTFIIAKDAEYFPQPTLEQLLERLPRQHPKLFLRPETVDTFRQNLVNNSPSTWTLFLDYAESLMKDPVITEEPPPYPEGRRGDNKENVDLWRKNRGIVQKAVDHAANLAFAYQLTGEKKYGERAREWIMAVVSWPVRGTTSYAYNDECAMPILSVIPRAYTWAWDMFNGKERESVIQTMTERGNEVYRHLLDRRHTVSPFESHRNRAWHFLNEAAVAFIDEIPDARSWLEYTMDIFFNVYPAWSDDDGGWHEGVAYWSSYMGRITVWLDMIKTAFRIDGYKKPFFRHAGDFPFYVLPPDQEFGGFGDSADTIKPADLAPVMNIFADRIGNPAWKWYAASQSPTENKERLDYSDLLRLDISSIMPQLPDDIPDSKIFHGTGIASLHSALGNTDEDIHILFKSSPFGSQSHGFNAQNSFLLWAYGRPLLHWSGHRDWHGSKHHTEWMWETFSDNSITVNGQGQLKHSPKARGKIIAESLNPRFDYVAGDATESYEGRLNRFIRHICFMKPRLILVMDELEAPEPSLFQYHLHANNRFSTKSQYEIETGDSIATARIALVTPGNLVITQTEGHRPPSVGYDRTQWNFQAETPQKVLQTNFLTLIRPYPSGKVLETKYDFASKDQVQMFFCAVDLHKVLVFINPKRESFTYGAITSDAGLMVMVTYDENADDSILFASSASRVEMSGQTIFQSDKPDCYFTEWKDLQKKP